MVVENRSLYERLARPFEKVYTREQAGQTFKYVTGEQVISRLNEECGLKGWSFEVVEHGINAEADETWCLVKLTVTEDGVPSTAFGFGGQKIKRRRDTGVPLNLGQDMKGAMTDALKVAAKHMGVALSLYDKEDSSGGQDGYDAPPPRRTPAPQNNTSASTDMDTLYCEECAEPLTETRFKDGTTWAPAQLAVFGRRKHSRILCMSHYREANDAKKRAEAGAGSLPF